MADKTSQVAYGLEPQQALVTTAGSSTLNITTFLWDDASTVGEIMEQLEKHKVQVLDYYNKR